MKRMIVKGFWKEVFILSLVMSCGNPKNGESLNNNKHWERAGIYINFDSLQSIDWLSEMENIEPGYTMLMYFDGDCPSCIISFLEFLEWRRQQTSRVALDCLFIVHAEDDLLLEYYLKEFDLRLARNEYLFIDVNNDFPKQNRELPLKSVTYFLLDQNQKILNLGYSFKEIVPQ